jgi:hypothetical protein
MEKKMAVQKELLAPCGLFCGVCSIRIAHVNDDAKFKEKLSGFYSVKPEEIHCDGCLSATPFFFCQSCPIKSCTAEKGYAGCHECADFPCTHVTNFPLPIAKKVMMRAVPAWKELGTEKWVEAEYKRYTCPSCGYALFRGAKRCRNCKTEVAVD